MRVDEDGMFEVEPRYTLAAEDRKLFRGLLYIGVVIVLVLVVGVGAVSYDTIRASQERDEQTQALVESEVRRRTNFELLTAYIICVVQASRAGEDPEVCPEPGFVPPPDEVELVPREDPRTGVTIPPEEEQGGVESPSGGS